MAFNFEYNKKDGKILLKLARESISNEFEKTKKLILPDDAKFKQARGVFITLNDKDGNLRGCIGFPYPDFNRTLFENVIEAAKQAAFFDPRFPPLKKSELKNIRIEISILTTPQKCSVKDIHAGKDGLMCEYIGYSGLLLPQVAKEYEWDKIKFLENLCLKAGLPRDAWQKQGFKLWKFQAQIFKEDL